MRFSAIDTTGTCDGCAEERVLTLKIEWEHGEPWLCEDCGLDNLRGEFLNIVFDNDAELRASFYAWVDEVVEPTEAEAAGERQPASEPDPAD